MVPRMRLRRPALATALLGTTLLLSGTAMAVNGTDVSRYQHPSGASIDWRAVKKAGQTFTFIKATEGTGVRNAYFAADWRDTKAAGLYRGAYHFARPSRASGSAVAQANAFVKVIGNQRVPGTLPPVLDLEANDSRMKPNEMIAWTRAFVTTVERKTGRRPIIYSYPGFWSASMGGTSAFAAYPLWIAHYTSAKGPRITGWSRWTFWQYTSSGKVNGIRGSVDRNRFNGSQGQLAVLALAAPPPDPAAPVPDAVTLDGLLDQALTGLGLPDVIKP